MKKIIIIYILCTAVLSCKARGQQIAIGKQYEINKSTSFQMLMTSGGSFDKAYKVTENGCQFIICLDSIREITYISTKDKAFKTPESVSVGKLITVSDKNKLINEPGWACYIKLDSGWNAIISYEHCAPSKTHKYIVKELFQRLVY